MIDIGLFMAFIFGCLTIYYTLKDYRNGKITQTNYAIVTVLEAIAVIGALVMVIVF